MIVPLESLVYAAMGAGQLVKARQTIEEGLQVARQIGDQWSEAWFLYWLTLVVLANADYEEAQAIADESLSLATICGDLWLRACLSVFVLGKTAIALKEYVAAIQHVKHGLGFFQEIGQPWGISVSYWSLANTAFLAQDYEDAEH